MTLFLKTKVKEYFEFILQSCSKLSQGDLTLILFWAQEEKLTLCTINISKYQSNSVVWEHQFPERVSKSLFWSWMLNYVFGTSVGRKFIFSDAFLELEVSGQE